MLPEFTIGIWTKCDHVSQPGSSNSSGMFCYRPSKLFLHRSMDRAPICKKKAKKIRKENHGESRGTRTYSFIPLLLSNLRFKSEKKEARARRVPTLNRILNMCSQPSFVVLGTLKGWYLVILSKGKQWAIFFLSIMGLIFR